MLEREDHEVVAGFIIAKGTRCGGAGFLMPGFAMDDAGDAVFGVAAHATPYFHHIAAGGIDNAASLGVDLIHEARGRTEGRHDNDIVGRELIVFGAQFLPWQGNDAHVDQLAVDLGVVDDFSNQENAVVGKYLARGVGEIDGALDAVTKAKFLSESDGGVTDDQFAMQVAQAFHDRGLVMLRHFCGDEFHHIGTAEVDALAFGVRIRRLWHGATVVAQDGGIYQERKLPTLSCARSILGQVSERLGRKKCHFLHVALVIAGVFATPIAAMATVGPLTIPNSSFSAIIFDCDGTLVDSMPAHFDAWCEALAQYGAANVLAEDVFYAMGGRPTKDIVIDLNAEYGLKLDPARVALSKREAFLRKLHRCELIEEVADFARQWRGKVPLGIATGGSRFVIEKTLHVLGVSDWFDEVITADDVSIGKPAPDIYLEAARRLGVPPVKCLAMEDAPAGVDSARAAGMMVVEIPCPLRV